MAKRKQRTSTKNKSAQGAMAPQGIQTSQAGLPVQSQASPQKSASQGSRKMKHS